MLKIDTTYKRRGRLGIIAEILNSAKDGILKTQIMYKANLSFAQLGEYIDYMLKTHLLHKLNINDKEVYIATDKGVDFLQKHAELTTMLYEEQENKNRIQLPPQHLIKKL
jgi:predicted transcriptional regulator